MLTTQKQVELQVAKGCVVKMPCDATLVGRDVIYAKVGTWDIVWSIGTCSRPVIKNQPWDPKQSDLIAVALAGIRDYLLAQYGETVCIMGRSL